LPTTSRGYRMPHLVEPAFVSDTAEGIRHDPTEWPIAVIVIEQAELGEHRYLVRKGEVQQSADQVALRVGLGRGRQ
jgi:hypothetical protein